VDERSVIVISSSDFINLKTFHYFQWKVFLIDQLHLIKFVIGTKDKDTMTDMRTSTMINITNQQEFIYEFGQFEYI